MFSDTPTVDTGDANYVGSILDSDDLNTGDLYIITVTGEIDSSYIMATDVVTVTRF